MTPQMDTQELLDDLVAVSRKYGADPAFVLAGGGNTSAKLADRLWVKGSGTALARLFVALLENFQQVDGSVLIPVPLQPYLKVDRLLPG